ncbi:MAG: glycosyltransferase family 2 protein [Alphaproteobacteria bacterium]|nr:glycosyltransferase family 2 protein [Alphaproteobacteria bacterium]
MSVSVIIPAYNVEEYIGTCLSCLTQQSLKDIEIICVDDGSTDRTVDIIKEYLNIDSRIKLLIQKHAGAGAARNNGMDNATRKYISFIDADDKIDFNFLQLLFEKAEAYDADIAAAGLIRIKGKLNKKLVDYKKSEKTLDLAQKTKLLRYPYIESVANKLFRLDFIKKNNICFQTIETSEDKLFVLQSILKCKNVVSVPNTNYYYCDRFNSSVHKKDKKTKANKKLMRMFAIKLLQKDSEIGLRRLVRLIKLSLFSKKRYIYKLLVK